MKMSATLNAKILWSPWLLITARAVLRVSWNGSKNSRRSRRELAARRWVPIKISSGEVWPNDRLPPLTAPSFYSPLFLSFHRIFSSTFPSFEFRPARSAFLLPFTIVFFTLSFFFFFLRVPRPPGRFRCSFHSSPFPSELFDAIKKPGKKYTRWCHGVQG